MRTIQSGSNYYKVDDQGQIIVPGLPASGSWKILGAVEMDNFGHNVRFFDLQTILNAPESIPWKFKNGKQRVHILDLDHGTQRVWMNPAHKIF